MLKNKAIFFLIISLLANITLATTLEEQFEGMKTCDQMGKLKDMNFDQYYQQASPAMSYILERKLQPCELGSLADYCIDDTFYGLKVVKISIPHTMSIYAIYFKNDIKTVKETLSPYMNISDYDRQKRSVDRPSILQHSESEPVILMCDFSSEKD